MRSSVTSLATGPRIHYVDAGDAAGEPLIFLHGWPDSSYSFSRLLPSLPGRYRCLVPDQRGFGESERPGDGYSIPALAADAVAFLDALSVPRATFVGHSLGSFIARCVAIEHPERVSRLVLIGSGETPVNATVREVYQSLGDLTDPVPTEFAREFQASTICKPIPDAFFNGLVAESLKLPARLWREVLAGLLEYDDSGQPGRIRVPTLLIWGDRDALFSKAEQNALVTAIPGARLLTYAGIGHCPNWECPEQVASDLADFLAQNG